MDIQALKLHKAVPLKGIRKFIAGRLGKVWQEAVHVTLHKDVDVTPFYQHKKEFSLIDYLLYGLVQALKEERFLSFNGHFDGQLFQSFSSVNLGLAVDHPKGLLVPVLHGADEMTLDAFVRARKEIIGRAKDWKHTEQELEHGTFTVSNLGTMGIDAFTPILNPPQVAILGLGRMRVESRSWNWDDELSPKALLTLSLTIDHRILDGADAARFLNSLENHLLTVQAI